MEPGIEFRYEFIYKCQYDLKAVEIEKFMTFVKDQMLPYYQFIEAYKDSSDSPNSNN